MTLSAIRLARAWASLSRHPHLVDALVGTSFGIVSLLVVLTGPRDNPGRSLTGVDVLIAAGVAVCVALRRRWPVPVLAVVTVGTAGALATDGRFYVLIAVSVICAYTVASRTSRTAGWTAGGAAALVTYLAAVVVNGNSWDAADNLTDLAWVGMSIAVGDAVRSRRAYVAAVEDRAARAEQSRDEEAQRRVTEERLRIARELHDSVAHHIALINVQSEVASHVLRQRPEQAEAALSQVRQSVKTVLGELSAVLTVLRRSDDPEPPTEPVPGLHQLARLLDTVAAAGLRVAYHQDGDPRPLPAAVDLAAYRIVQESLTNAQKHGGDRTVDLRLSYTTAGLDVVVQNRVDPGLGAGSGSRTGHGMVGMRERAASVGGILDAGPGTDDQFAVHAFLPAPVAQEVAP